MFLSLLVGAPVAAATASTTAAVAVAAVPAAAITATVVAVQASFYVVMFGSGVIPCGAMILRYRRLTRLLLQSLWCILLLVELRDAGTDIDAQPVHAVTVVIGIVRIYCSCCRCDVLL